MRSAFTVATAGPKNIEHDEWAGGKVGVHEIPVTEDDFTQATALWKLFATQAGEQEGFIRNVAGDVKEIPKFLQEEVFAMFARVDPEIESRLRAQLKRLA